MIPENAETGHIGERGQESMGIGHSGVEVLSRGIAKVAGNDDGVAGNSPQTANQRISEFGSEVEMQIGELHQAEALKGRGQTGEMPSALDQLWVEMIGAGAASEPGKDQALVDEGVEWEVLFESEDATALVGHLRPVAGLGHESALETLRS